MTFMRCVPVLAAALATQVVLTGSAAADAVNPSDFPARILADHNSERAAVGAAPLVWDNDLAAGALDWAAHMASTGVFEHSDRHARRGIGEDIWFGTRGAYSLDEMVRAWASEKPNFVPGVFPNVSRTGNWLDVSHYTQVIWPKTQRIGCALSSNASTDYVVCRYSPAGNIDGVHIP